LKHLLFCVSLKIKLSYFSIKEKEMKKISTLLLIAALFCTQIIFSQITRKVLFEEGTNASCGPCAANNPILKAFLDANVANVLAIKYHASWPGYDPMYAANPSQNTERIVNYYNMNSSGVPYCNCDGLIQDIWPFSNTAFMNAMNTRLAVPAPLSITVTDQRIAGDSIRATIIVNIPTALSAGTYYLRVMAMEGTIVYPTPPGSNGETIFEHVFRKAYPNTTGTSLTTTAGNYQYVFTYKKEASWVDTAVFTIAFVQNDVNKEILNSAKGSNITSVSNNQSELPSSYSLSQNYPNPFNPSTKINFSLPKDDFVTLKVFDILGNETAVLANGNFKAGSHSIDFDASALATGIYFYKMTAGSFSETRKMTLVK
jgi:hypothetical protein